MNTSPNNATLQSNTPEQEYAQETKLINLSITKSSSHIAQACVEIGSNLILPIYNQTVNLFKKRHQNGFSNKDVPVEYLEETHNQEINQKLKNYIFNHIVIDFLINELINQKIPFANYPRLNTITNTDQNNISYIFDLSLTEPIELKEWKNFAFKSPKRKRYKDLDKQVKQFLESQSGFSSTTQPDAIEESDWVQFSAILLDENNTPLLQELESNFWIKIQQSELSCKFKNTFIGKNLGETFISNNLNFDDSSEAASDFEHTYLVTIKAIVKGQSLSIERFKQLFKLKNKTEIHNKIMEVFSYRNDISQRKNIIEEIFNLLLSKHRFEIPKHLVLRKQEEILLNLTAQPDYHVYKSQKDFLKCVELLAEKNLKEESLIDQIAYHENIKIDTYDIQNYLNLLNQKRMCEFVYFKPPIEKIEDLHTPFSHSIISHTVLREKTMNYVIYNLTK
jgi:FKBP-type peptidyl-prolyl cis-trans isomerase (trigger factor)